MEKNKEYLVYFIVYIFLEYFLLIFSTAGDAIVTNILGILIWFKASNKE